MSVLHICFTETSLSSISSLQQPCFIVVLVKEGFSTPQFPWKKVADDIYLAREVVGRRPSPIYSMHTRVLWRHHWWEDSVKKKNLSVFNIRAERFNNLTQLTPKSTSRLFTKKLEICWRTTYHLQLPFLSTLKLYSWRPSWCVLNAQNSISCNV